MNIERIIIPLLVGLIVPSLRLGLSQRLSPEVLAVGGGIDKNGSLSLEWTLGEAVIETVSLSDRIYTQGFHQPMLVVDVYWLIRLCIYWPHGGDNHGSTHRTEFGYPALDEADDGCIARATPSISQSLS